MLSLLIVDDDPIILKVIVKMLQNDGYVCHTAINAAEAERVVGEQAIDIMLVDVVMPERGGLQFIMEEYRKNPKVRTILMSGNVNLASDSLKILADQFGVRSTLQKPFTREELLAKLQGCL